MRLRTSAVCLIALITVACAQQRGASQVNRPMASNDLVARLVAAADDRPNHPARYDPGYVKIAYPNGDVPVRWVAAA